jgi:probable HAF family extracellular repeat protein
MLTESVRDELVELAFAVCDATASDEQIDRLEALLADQPAARLLYLQCLELHFEIGRRPMPLGARGEALAAGAPATREDGMMKNVIPPIVLAPTPGSHTPLLGFHSPVGGFLFSYGMSAVILGIALVVGWAWRVSLVDRTVPTAASQVVGPDGRKPAGLLSVGRIIGTADCHWTDPQVEVARGDVVRLGQEYRLAAGCLEIGYDSGAKVILQGPCRYVVESKTGGFLGIGKLTARVESRADHSQLSTLNSRLFSVRTPTAIVTDLGTEFGVEVETSGKTYSHVFRGKIELRAANGRESATPNQRAPEAVELTRGQSATVPADRGDKIKVVSEPARVVTARFIREMPLPSGGRPPRAPLLLSRENGHSVAYRAVDLGTLGGPWSVPTAINRAGQVVGRSATSTGTTHAFLYTGGRMKDLGVLRGGNSRAASVNSAGDVVGDSGSTFDDCVAFLYTGGAMKGLGTLGGATSVAVDINDAGTVVGVSRNRKGIERAFLYTAAAGMKDLGSLGGPDASSCAQAINAAGQVVGYSQTTGGKVHAFLFTPAAGMKDLGAMGGDQSWAVHIADDGRVLGYFATGRGPYRAFAYSNQGVKDLGVVGEPSAAFFGPDRMKQVMGILQSHGGVSTFFCEHGEVSRFFVPTGAVAGVDTEFVAVGRNPSGQVACYGRPRPVQPNTAHAFLLTPEVKASERK